MTSSACLLQPLTDIEARSSDCGLSRAERAEQTDALLRSAHDTTDPDEAARLRARAVLINRGVAEAVAGRYRHRGIAQDDLNQVAFEGLTKAVTRFDPDLRNDLLTFAVPTIRGELQRYFRDQGWTVRPPRRIQETQGRAHTAVRDLEQSLGREPNNTEVADELGISTDDYGEAMAALGCFRPTSLDLPVGTDSATLGDLLTDDGEEEAHEASDARVMLAPVVRRLSDRDRRILYLRFFEDLTQAEIGADLGVTQMQVSRLLSRILDNLRHDLEGASER
jgi:RNA polymerase sigma-B factor